MMTVDQRILAKRLEIQQLRDEEERKRQELHALFAEKAQAACPIAIGTKVEYEPGKFGQVDRVEFFVEYWNELEPTAEVHWTVTGRKINKTGEFGVKDFHPVGPATHYVTGTIFKHKGIGGVLGVQDDDA
jgi:hypothetical protein